LTTTPPGYVPPIAVTDPFPQTKFRVVWDSKEIPGISSISPLQMTIAAAGSTSGTGDGTTIGTTVGTTGTVISSSSGSTTGSTNVLTAAEQAAAEALAAAEQAASDAVNSAEQAVSNAAQSAENAAQSVLSDLDPFADRRARDPAVAQWTVAPVEFTRPRTADQAFQSWALAPVAKHVLVELFNLAGGAGLTFQLGHCIPIAYVPLDTVDAESSGVALERLTVSCTSIVTVPGEPANTK
jgi:hypothetical protein